MKVVILAGGLGTRLAEETEIKPKPMVEIGGRPILWHIMKLYTAHGFTDFIICLGYKGYVVKDFFTNYASHMSDLTIDMATGETVIHAAKAEPWRVTLVDTGDATMTAGRLLRVRHLLGADEPFCMTYGDGVGDVDITALVAFHKAQGLAATVTAVHPPGRFGVLETTRERVTDFVEKPHGEGGRINGGFFVLEPAALDAIETDTMWEQEPMRRLVAERQLAAFNHDGFWQPMDTLRDKRHLEDLWQSEGGAPWKCW